MQPSTHVSKGLSLETNGWICFAIGVAIVALRCYTVSLSPRGARLTWDLIFILIAAASAIASQPFLVLASRNGIDSTKPSDLRTAYLCQWIYLPLTVIATVFAKFSNIALLIRLQRQTKSRHLVLLYLVATLSAIMGLLLIALQWAQCSHVPDLWMTDPVDNDHCHAARAWLSIGVAQGSLSALVDFFLASYPIVLYWRLRLPSKQRAKIFLLFSGGYCIEQFLAISVTIIPRLRSLAKLLRTRLGLARATLPDSDRPSGASGGGGVRPHDVLDLDLDGRPVRPEPEKIRLPPRIEDRIERRRRADQYVWRRYQTIVEVGKGLEANSAVARGDATRIVVGEEDEEGEDERSGSIAQSVEEGCVSARETV
ncbi:hypothetical protein ANO11243_093370 [Dothideomycetidae sp. 11243]|nr:hypothetical protein ANO11243_093370 [fungal sp. No.11243]